MFGGCKLDPRLSAVAVCCLVLLATARTAAAQIYHITDIGTLGGDESSYATGINNAGDVVGVSVDKRRIARAFVWSGGKISHIQHLTKKHSYATGINDLGQVIGYTVDDRGPYHAYIYSVDGERPIEIPPLPGGEVALAAGINNAGDVVGRAFNPRVHDHDDGEHAFRYRNGVIVDLQVLLSLEKIDGVRSDAIGINNSGNVTGHLYSSSHIGYSRGYFHRDGHPPIDIGTLGGRNTVVNGINDADQVVGYSQTLDGSLRAFVWDRVHKFLVIHPFPGGTQSLAYDVNNRGQVVGAADSALNRLRAFLYSGGGIRDLNGLISPGTGWELVTAKAINDKGQIVGEGVIRGERHAFLLTPKPD